MNDPNAPATKDSVFGLMLMMLAFFLSSVVLSLMIAAAIEDCIIREVKAAGCRQEQVKP